MKNAKQNFISKKYQKQIKSKIRKYPLLFSVFLLLFFIGRYYIPETSTTNSQNPQDEISLVKCIDGDTARFQVAADVVKIRFSGINTPEYSQNKKEPFGQEAAIFTCQKLTNAQTLSVEWDTTQKDSYDRKIGIVFVDGQNLNILLLEEGYADLKYLKDTMPYADEYRKVHHQAVENKVGRYA